MKLKELYAEGVRSLTSTTLAFGEKTALVGRNGAGKSSVAEAVVWCLYGTDGSGVKNQDGRLVRRGAKALSVVTQWEKDDGSALIVERTRKGKAKAFLLINGESAEEHEIEGLFGPVTVFLSQFRAGYFSSLEPKEARAAIATVLPELEKGVVLAGIEPDKRLLLEKVQLGGGIATVDVAMQKTRSLRKETEDELRRLEGQLIAAGSEESALGQEEVTEPEPFTQEDEAALVAAKKAVEAKRDASIRWDARVKTLREELERAKVAYREAKAGLPSDASALTCPACVQPLPPQRAAEVVQKAKQKVEAVSSHGKALREELEGLLAAPVEPVDPSLIAKVAALEGRKTHFLAQKAAYDAVMAVRNRQTATKGKVEEDMRRTKDVLALLDAEIDALAAYRVAYAKEQAKAIQQHLSHAELVLFRVAPETGEVLPDFGITWKGRPYRTLSTSERVRCDVEMARAMALAKGETMPVFIDDAELVQGVLAESFSGQVIIALVGSGELRAVDATQHIAVRRPLVRASKMRIGPLPEEMAQENPRKSVRKGA